MHRVKQVVAASIATIAMPYLVACVYVPRVADGETFRSEDGQLVAVVQKGTVLLNGEPGPLGFDAIYEKGVKFCAKSKRVGYIAIKDSKVNIIVDGRVYGPFENLEVTGLRFSPKCKRAAVAIKSGGKWYQWIDGELSLAYDGVAGEPIAYSDDESLFAYSAKRGEQWLVVSGRREVYADPYRVGLPDRPMGFLSTGELYFFSFDSDRKIRLHIGDSIGESYKGLGAGGAVLSPDRRYLAYSITRGGSWFHCVNLICQKQNYEYPGTALFVPEGLLGPTFWKNTGIAVLLNLASVAAGGGGHYSHPDRKAWGMDFL